MSREAHVRFWESVGVRFPRATRLPLYRQHQRLSHAGIQVSRSNLTTWVGRAIDLLQPIVEAQYRHVLQSKILAMDETPIRSAPISVQANSQAFRLWQCCHNKKSCLIYMNRGRPPKQEFAAGV